MAVGTAITAACTSFKGEADPVDGGSSGDDAAIGFDGSVSEASGTQCRDACNAPCIVDRLDSMNAAWTMMSAPPNVLQFAGGFMRSTVPADGAAYLDRRFTLASGKPFHMSFEVFVEVEPKNGTSLAKLVDGAGSEVNIQVDDKKVATCVHAKENQPATPCSAPAGELHLGDRVRLTLDAVLPTISAPGQLSVRVGCDPPATFPLPRLALLRAGVEVSLHLGVEGPGASIRYDEVDLLLPE